MKQIKLLSTLVLSGALVACGGSGSPSTPDLCDDLGFENCNLTSSSAQSSSSSSSSSDGTAVNALPILEEFDAVNAVEFFSASYKELETVNPDDPSNAFYYSTSGLESGRMVVGDGKFTIGNARFTLGQTLVTEGTHINPEAPPADYRVNTTTSGTDIFFPTTTTWGEMDLSQNWKISFCVLEWEHTGSSPNNQLFQLMLDNNQSGSALSIHGDSRIKELNVANFTPGKRVEINVPGDVLVGGVAIDGVIENKGTSSSFIQIRVPSAAVLTMDNLWIGYQSDTSTEPSADDCSAGTRVPGWNVPLPPIMSTAPVLVAGNGQISVDWEAADRATEYTVAYSTVNSTTGATLISGITETETVITELTNNTEYFVFVQGVNDGGSGEFSPGASATPVAPLVAPTTPTELTLEAGDQQLTATWNSVAGAETYTLAYNLVNDAITGATLVEDIPADALSETASFTITGLSNGNNYYVFVKAVNAAGESDFTLASSATPVEPVGEPNTVILQETFETTRDQFFTVNYKTLTSDPAIPMYFVEGGGSGITLDEAEGTITLANGGRFTIGQVSDPAPADTTGGDMTVNGDLDLSQPYTIIINVVSASDTGNFQVYVDNNTTGQNNSVHGGNSRIYSAAASTIADGTEIRLEVGGPDIPYVGTANSFVQLRTDSSIGAEGIVISEVRIEQPAAGGEAWDANVLHMFGTEGPDVTGNVSINEEDTLTFTASGGDLGSSHFRAFYAHRPEPVEVPFTFTARLVSIEKTGGGIFSSTGNSRRYGLMVMEDIEPVAEGGSYIDVPRFSGIELYASTNAPTFQGSRTEKRDIGTGSSRGRGDADGVAIGGYLRISVDFVDVGGVQTLRSRRYFSADGITYTLFNTNSNFTNANGNPFPSSMYVGFHAAPRDDELTFVYDNITITPDAVPSEQ